MFNENLKALRNKKKVSQQDIADYLQITRQAYNNYEIGKRQPDYETLLKLGEYFNVTVDDLINGDLVDIDENLVILNRNAKKLSSDKRQKLLDVARAMFKEDFDDNDT